MWTGVNKHNFPKNECHGHVPLCSRSIAAASGRAICSTYNSEKINRGPRKTDASRLHLARCHAEGDGGRPHAQRAPKVSAVCDVLVLMKV